VTSKGSNRTAHDPLLWPLLLVVIGVVLSLHNFLILGDFNPVNLLPLLLVILGVQILLRGDLLPSIKVRNFGITRGSVESGALTISSGEIDVSVNGLDDEQERLIAGQTAYQSRPALDVDGVRANLVFDRRKTPWFSFADWQLSIAQDLPWQVNITTSLGQVECDMSELIGNGGLIASGLGDIQFIAPYESFDEYAIQSTLGNINIIVPEGTRCRVTIQNGRFSDVIVHDERYIMTGEGVYESLNYHDDAPLVEIHLRNQFGNLYLA